MTNHMITVWIFPFKQQVKVINCNVDELTYKVGKCTYTQSEVLKQKV